MATKHCEGGFWIVWSHDCEGFTEVEHVATYEQARARFQALAKAAAVGLEVSDGEGFVILHTEMERIEMRAPRCPGRYLFLDEAHGFQGAAS